jgi:hypothetical protein
MFILCCLNINNDLNVFDQSPLIANFLVNGIVYVHFNLLINGNVSKEIDCFSKNSQITRWKSTIFCKMSKESTKRCGMFFGVL